MQKKESKHGFLCVSLNEREFLDIHNGLVEIRIKKIKGKQVFISIKAPREIQISRVKE